MDGSVAPVAASGRRHEALEVPVTGMSCAACVRRVERVLGAVPGVNGVSVNLATERARVGGEPDLDALRAALVRAGFGMGAMAEPVAAKATASPVAPSPAAPGPDREALLAAGACLLAAPLLLPMVLAPFGMHAMLPETLQLVLAATVQFGFGARFFRGAWNALRGGAANMDVLVAVGTGAAFGLSAWQLAAGATDHLYFEAAAAVIALVRLGKWLEGRARREAGAAIRALQRLRPELARLVVDGAEREVPVRSLRPGDLLAVRPGERLPADGTLRDGAGGVDESLLTGEAFPVAKGPGNPVTGGSLNGDAPLLVVVTAVAGEGRLDRMIRLVEDAQAAKPAVQRAVDRVSAVFVPTVIVLAVLTVGAWLLAGAGWEAALITGVSVLVIACPCALGLATPAAIAAGTGVAARHGILLRDPEAIEAGRRLRTVVLDKTGTLTEGRPTLMAVEVAAGTTPDEVRLLAATLGAGSGHPLARALPAAEGAGPALREQRNLPGRGVAATLDGRPLLLGNRGLLAERGLDAGPLAAAATREEAAGRTVSFLADGTRVLGVLAFGDSVRPGARTAVAALRARGLRVVMVTGDGEGAAGAVAAATGITEVRARALPEAKAAIVVALRADGGVAMVGDGVNDAAALAAASLGVAVGSGTDAAAAAAGITLMRDDPRLIPAALDIAARIDRRIRAGLFWAFAYNLVGLPLAASGLLSPVVAGAAMAFSSAAVVGNALLLRRWRPA